jgi:glycosyltransferase involved in cell wall biosynthesis
MNRILHVIPTLDRCGAEKQLLLLARGLPRDEFEIHVAVLTRTGPLEAEFREAEIPLAMVGKQWKADPLAYFRLRRLIRRLSPDLVHTWLFAANAYGRAAAAACGVKCLVASERCVDPWKGWVEFAIDRRLARKTARIVVNSAGVKDFYVPHGLPAEKFAIIPNGIAAPRPSPVPRAAIFAELGLPEDSFLIGLVGRFWPQKRVKDAIWGADLLQVIRQDFQFVIVGDGPLRQRLEQFRDQCELHDRVHFLGQRSDVPRLLPHFDVLWSTSGYEGQSNAIMEAMAAGVPVVATDIPGNRDLVVHGQTGFLVPLGDRTPLVKHTRELLDNPALRRQFGEAARARMAAEFSVEQMVRRYAELYRELLS